MPKYNNIEIRICGKKYIVQSNETVEYVKNIEDMINSKVSHFKNESKNFDNYSSVVFTAFVIADKYIKAIEDLEKEKSKTIDIITLGDIKRMKEEKSRILTELDSNIHEKERLLQDLIQRNSEVDIANNKLKEYANLLNEKNEEIKLLNEMNEELSEKLFEIKKETMMLKTQMEFREE